VRCPWTGGNRRILAAIDVLSGGRLVVGLGPVRRLGLRTGRRELRGALERLDEAVQTLRAYCEPTRRAF